MSTAISLGARKFILANLKHPLWQETALKDIEVLTAENENLKKKLAILQSDMVAIAYQAEQSLKQTKV